MVLHKRLEKIEIPAEERDSENQDEEEKNESTGKKDISDEYDEEDPSKSEEKKPNNLSRVQFMLNVKTEVVVCQDCMVGYH